MQNKWYRKIHYIFWHRLHPGQWSLWLYPAYWHEHFHRKRHRKENTAEEERYLTQVPNAGAGIGHQMGNWNAGYWFAEKFKIKYAYSPFSDAGWDKFLGFGQNEVMAFELLRKGYKKRKLPYFDEKSQQETEMINRIIDSYEGQKVVFFLQLDQFYEDQFGVMKAIKRKFNEAEERKNDNLIYGKDCINIAVHIRRGDIVIGQKTQEEGLMKRWLTTGYYEKILQSLEKEVLKGQKFHMYLFSQGKPEDFPELQGISNLSFCLDMTPKECFLHMVKADILVTSKSSFSYKPALLSDGIKLCPAHFWHGYPEGETWILIEEESSLTREQRNKLTELVKRIKK